jgi:hypothetical protein
VTDLVAVAAYAKVQGLTNDECVTLWNRFVWENVADDEVLDLLDRGIIGIKRARRPAPMPAPHTHEQWSGGRQDRAGHDHDDDQRPQQ